MIVRINQFKIVHTEHLAGWPAHGAQGPLGHLWPEGTLGFELLILDQDERGNPLPPAFRQAQTRRLIPEIVASLREEHDQIVTRLDGPMAPKELLTVNRHLLDAHGHGRFAISPAKKLHPNSAPPITSARLQKTPKGLVELCQDPDLGLEHNVRLRAAALPELWANVFLDIEDTNDSRWSQTLSHAAFILSTTRTLHSLHLITRRFRAAEIKERLTRRLFHSTSPNTSTPLTQPHPQTA